MTQHCAKGYCQCLSNRDSAFQSPLRRFSSLYGETLTHITQKARLNDYNEFLFWVSTLQRNLYIAVLQASDRTSISHCLLNPSLSQRTDLLRADPSQPGYLTQSRFSCLQLHIQVPHTHPVAEDWHSLSLFNSSASGTPKSLFHWEQSIGSNRGHQS